MASRNRPQTNTTARTIGVGNVTSLIFSYLALSTPRAIRRPTGLRFSRQLKRPPIECSAPPLQTRVIFVGTYKRASQGPPRRKLPKREGSVTSGSTFGLVCPTTAYLRSARHYRRATRGFRLWSYRGGRNYGFGRRGFNTLPMILNPDVAWPSRRRPVVCNLVSLGKRIPTVGNGKQKQTSEQHGRADD